MKPKTFKLAYAFLILLLSGMVYMIIIGMNGTALTAKQDVFTYPIHSSLSTDPKTYFKGVTDPKRVQIDLSHVNTHIPGIYTVHARQSSRIYEFKIEIK